MRVGIALGSNLGDRGAQLQSALNAIRQFAEPPVKVSRVYETEPVDCPPGSPTFLNAVVEIGWSNEIHDLLTRLQAIETEHGRPGDRTRNAPRTVDLDILYADELRMTTPALELPHPRMTSRSFVLLPLADILQNQRIPGDVKTPEDYIKTQNLSEYRISESSIY